jgi:hypothetical protein
MAEEISHRRRKALEDIEVKTRIFEEAGPHNTEVTFQITREWALALGIKQLVAASSHRRVGPVEWLVTPKRNQCVTGPIKL